MELGWRLKHKKCRVRRRNHRAIYSPTSIHYPHRFRQAKRPFLLHHEHQLPEFIACATRRESTTHTPICLLPESTPRNFGATFQLSCILPHPASPPHFLLRHCRFQRSYRGYTSRTGVVAKVMPCSRGRCTASSTICALSHEVRNDFWKASMEYMESEDGYCTRPLHPFHHLILPKSLFNLESS
jgi:hypothetical protein